MHKFSRNGEENHGGNWLMPKIHYTHFPITSSWTGKWPICYGLVANLLAKWPTSLQQVGNKSL